MKLAEILAVHLESWATTTLLYVQDPDGYCWPLVDGDAVFSQEDGGWGNAEGDDISMDFNWDALAPCLPILAEDYATARVTKAQWEAARVALAGKGGAQ